MPHTLVAKKSGFTIVESLVALGIVAVVSLSGLATMSYIRKVKNRSKEVCMAHVSSTVEKFRSVGYFSAINDFTPLQASNNFTPPLTASLSGRGIADNYMYPSTVNIIEGGPAPTINNNILITSSLNALLAIYNSNAAFCTNPAGSTYANSSGAPASQGFGYASPDLDGSSMTLQIIPFDTTTGALDNSCPTNLRITPPGRFSDNQPGSAFEGSTPKSTRGPNRTNIGLRLRVTQNYTDEDGLGQSCTIEQRFQYSTDTAPPPQPDFKTMTRLSGPLPAQSCVGSASVNSYEVTLGYSNSLKIEPGSVMVCRDLSFVPTATKAGYVLASCSGAGRPDAVVASEPYQLASDIGITGMTYSQYPTLAASPARRWVSCDQVTVCGVSPVATLDGTIEHPRYRLVYNNLPARCRAYIQMAAIDTASNSSTTVVSASLATDNTIANLADNRLQWDVPTTRCGTRCGPPWPVQVYYRCTGGCP